MLVKTADFVIGPVFDAVDIGLVLLDNQQCIVGWNEWIARVSRLSAEDVLGKNLCDVFTDLRSGRLGLAAAEQGGAGTWAGMLHNSLGMAHLERGESSIRIK